MSNTPNTTSEPKHVRPGAMTRAMRAVAPSGERRQLRIAIIQAGKIIEERLIHQGKDVTVGTSEKNTFAIHGAAAMPAETTLFRWVKDHYELQITAHMTGRLGAGGTVELLEELHSSGGSTPNTTTHAPLTENSRGKVSIGATTLLFQFVAPPPPVSRPQLPAAVRGGFAKNIDWVFTAFVVFSYMGFFGLVVYLENADWQMPQQIGVVPASMARLVFEEPEPPLEPRLTPEVFDAPVEEIAPDIVEEPEFVLPAEETVASRERPTSDARLSRSSDSSEEAMPRLDQDIVDAALEAAQTILIGAVGEEGSALDVLIGGAPTEDAGSVLARVAGGVEQASRTTVLRERHGPQEGSGERRGLGVVRNSNGTPMRAIVEEHTEREIRFSVRAERGEEMGGQGDFTDTFSHADVIRGIRGRMRLIRACYERQLINDSGLRGRVSIDFTVTPRGSLSGVSVSENTTRNAALGVCIQHAIRGLSFRSGPEGGGVQFSFPFVLAPQ